MRRLVTPVTVTTRNYEANYDWATSVRVDRRGDLRVYQGLRQRIFHPAGEWTMYKVTAPAPPVSSTRPVLQPRMD